MERRYALLNVFSNVPQGGNPLAVITDTDGLDDATMQAIAKKLGLSETVFVLPAQNPAHTASIRIFTPATEVPFAGHPSVGTAVYLAQDRVWRKTGEECDALVVLEAKAGIMRIAVKPGANAPFAEFDAPVLPKEAGETPPTDRLAAALGLAPTEIGFENFKPCRYSAGNLFTFVPIKGLDAIRRARVVEQYWKEAFGGETPSLAYLYCRDTMRHKSSFHARCFAPDYGVPEDPATGSAATAFSAVINRFDGPPEGTYNGVIEQGFEIDCPSEIHLEFEVLNRQIRVVRIGGHAVFIREDTVAI